MKVYLRNVCLCLLVLGTVADNPQVKNALREKVKHYKCIMLSIVIVRHYVHYVVGYTAGQEKI